MAFATVQTASLPGPHTLDDVNALLADPIGPPEERIPLLGRALRRVKTRYFRDRYPESADQAFERLQKALLVIPGHAEHYGEELARRRAEALADGSKFHSFEEYAGHAYKVLEHLPSAETVTVMARFLHDNMSSNDPVPDAVGFGPPGTNARHIIRSLIQDPPTDHPYLIEPWLEWRRQIEAGERSFQLKGSSTRYNFRGVVGAKPLDARPSRRASPDRPPAKPLAAKESRRLPAVALALAAVVVLGALVWLVVARRVGAK